MTRIVFACALFIASLFLGCVPAPEDPLDYGRICTPGSPECASSVELDRDVTGRNQIDYVVRNVGQALAVVEVVAVIPSAEFGSDAGFDDIDPDELITRREHDPLEPGESAENRFTAQDLGVRTSLRLGMRCNGCEAELEWVFASVPRECFENNDCAAGWQCDDNLGRCVECVNNADCAEDQRCNISTGRCDPPVTTAGCDSAGSDNSFAAVLLFLFVVCFRRAFRRYRSVTSHERPVHAFAVALAFGALLLATSPAQASPPRASIAVGAGARVLSGKLGPVTRRGVGLAIGQELRWRYLGAGLALDTSYFLTDQEPPPFSRSFQTYGATLGPRFYLPIGFLEIAAGADYRRLGTSNNSLVRLTGTRTSFNAAGGFAGVRFRWSGLEVRIESSTHYVFELDSTLTSADLFLGFTNVR